ncbi:glycerophosphodiester phosphodiesterase [Aquibacillus koreensis]|uniref:Glycerophosphodiester phosphodiesterase n=1 Tax=Aquibacillus koreensis TaxID=279446 RepID=A0A9X3WFL9_9BACI|nr:glycerophosphodiester phosphodiesterase [Aquibacillus koreensis]MCT2537461.1 glycerophosphodiester phosphodiesterase [Aquibacillus koreensis]MDC3418907.1 glycerophosphodiester phosphodiesterase [Aquibacillus koreensis]
METIVYAHRGASKLAPENTLPAFELAYHMGADGIETDVQLTKDQVPVLIHDENVRRTTNGIGFVQDYTFKELQKLDAGSWLSDRYAQTRVPSLESFLEWVKDKPLKINIELKNNVIDYKDMEKIVYDLLASYNVLDRTVISSFNSKSIKKVEKIDPTISKAYLTSQKIKDLIPFAKAKGATGLHIRNRILSKPLVEKAHKEDLYVAVYTVNRPSLIMRCYKLGVDAIFTDVPHVAKKTLEQYKKKQVKDK